MLCESEDANASEGQVKIMKVFVTTEWHTLKWQSGLLALNKLSVFVTLALEGKKAYKHWHASKQRTKIE